MKILRFWFAVVCYSGIIFYVSNIPSPDSPVKIPHFDKAFHFSEYLFYGYLVAAAFFNTWPKLSKMSLFSLALLFCCVYAASDEFHQSFIVGRSCSIFDWTADALGSALGNYLCIFKRKQGK